MASCCQISANESSTKNGCPVCHQKGKRVPLITLKSLLKPTALETLKPEENYAFCSNPSCEVVYFSGSLSLNKLKFSLFFSLSRKISSLTPEAPLDRI